MTVYDIGNLAFVTFLSITIVAASLFCMRWLLYMAVAEPTPSMVRKLVALSVFNCAMLLFIWMFMLMVIKPAALFVWLGVVAIPFVWPIVFLLKRYQVKWYGTVTTVLAALSFVVVITTMTAGGEALDIVRGYTTTYVEK